MLVLKNLCAGLRAREVAPITRRVVNESLRCHSFVGLSMSSVPFVVHLLELSFYVFRFVGHCDV